MNKLNGWIRLWVLLSIPFWIMSLYFVFNDVQSPEERNRSITFSDYDQSYSIKGCYSYECEFALPPDEETITAVLKNEYKKEVARDYERAFYIATVVPFSLLALGYGIAWVRRGFKNTN